MTGSTQNRLLQQLFPLLVGMVVLGSLWGMSEVVLGGGLRAANFPYRSGLLTGIGVAIMGVALVGLRQPLMLVGIGLVAVLVKLLAVPILHTSFMCNANSCLAVGIEATSLGLVGALFMRRMKGNVYAQMGGGALAALTASVGFYLIGTHVAPCNYLLSFTGPMSFVMKEGLVWAAFSAILLPFGYLIGETLQIRPVPVLVKGNLPYYPSAAAVVVVTWGASALAMMVGL